MFIFCLIALALGGILATAVRVFHMCIGLVVLTIAGIVEAYYVGAHLTTILIWAGALFASAQVGYVAGAAVLAYLGARRAENSKIAGAKKSALSRR